MKNERFLLYILAVVQFLHIIDFMMIMPLGSQFMRVFDISPKQFSLLVTCYALTAAASGLVSAMFIDRYDRKDVLLLSFIGFALGTWACAFSPNYSILLIARSLTGAFGGLLTGLTLSIVGDVIPIERRGAAMSIIMTAFAVASIFGVPAGLGVWVYNQKMLDKMPILKSVFAEDLFLILPLHSPLFPID